MKIRILGAGWYGCHLAVALLADGHDVEVHECAAHIFAGASGGNPARLHIGLHYPRSKKTRDACKAHAERFSVSYGTITRGVPVNLYAVAEHDSFLDFGTYRQIMAAELETITVQNSQSLYGLAHVEGALLTGERHIVIAEARRYFLDKLRDRIRYETAPGAVDDSRYDLTIDCTFCSNDATNIDRFEPCVTALLEGPTDMAVTIMDGPFPSLYPWNEQEGLCSLTSAKWTPLAKCATYAEARHVIDSAESVDLAWRVESMLDQMAHYYPAVRDSYRIAGHKLSIRAQPRSGADARLCEVVKVGERALRVRAGKIDAVFHAEDQIRGMLNAFGTRDKLDDFASAA